METCSKCGTAIKNVVMIHGKGYGTECATKVLGISQMPTWFKGGDWDSAKSLHDANQAKQIMEFELRKEYTKDSWSDFVRLSNAKKAAYRNGDDWGLNFIDSIASKLGFLNLTSEGCKFKTFEEAQIGWKEYMGSFPYLYRKCSAIVELSENQIALFEKIESRN